MSIHKRFRYWSRHLLAPETVLKERYAAYKRLLAHDKRAHTLMAELEEIFYRRQARDFSAVRALISDLSQAVAAIIEALEGVCPGRYGDLKFFHRKIDTYIRYITEPEAISPSPPYALPLNAIDDGDLHRVGGKAFNLGRIKTHLGLPVPDGFVITTAAQEKFFAENGLRSRIDDHLTGVDAADSTSLEQAAAQIQALILAAQLPRAVTAALVDAHGAMTAEGDASPRAALRSSAVGEDGRASFAGQFLSLLNVQSHDLAATYKRIIAGKYTPEAIAYRIHHGLSDMETPMAVLVLEMVPAVSSGVMYTADPENPLANADRIQVHAVWGLGELLVSGQTPADIFTVTKAPPHVILDKRGAKKAIQLSSGDAGGTISEKLPKAKAQSLALVDDQVVALARMAVTLEDHYGHPQDIEWAADRSGALYLLQSRPLNRDAELKETPTCTFETLPNQRLVSNGDCAAGGIAAGPVFQAGMGETLAALPRNAVLVATSALPTYAKVMERVGAIVTAAGSTAGHLATVAREFGVPMVVNASGAIDHLGQGEMVTVHADDGAVYAGRVAQMLASPCARTDTEVDTPLRRKLAYLLSFVATLDLVDPQAADFSPRRCRSFHDIIRFAHEKAVAAMFHISDNRLRKLDFAKKLSSPIPMLFYLLDVGGGLAAEAAAAKEVPIEAVRNPAMRALWRGLSHPDIQWGDFSHFDWEAHDRMVMSGGIASPESAMYASHAVISNDYMNLNLRFGYHFVIVDALCEGPGGGGSLLFRFSGGGANMDQRMLRTEFPSRILRRLDFTVTLKSDLIDAQYSGGPPDILFERLDMLGRLLGATRLMDMYLKEAGQIDQFVEAFLGGQYHFATVEMD